MSRCLAALVRVLSLTGLLLAGDLASPPPAHAAAATQHEEPAGVERASGAAGQAAEHHAEPGINPRTLALQLLNFALLLAILIKCAGGALNKALRERHEQLKTNLEEAAQVRAAAQQRFHEQERRLANLEHEIEAMRKAIVAEAEGEKGRIVAAAAEKARRIQDETRFQLEQQVKEAELRFRAAVAEAAVKIADELLRRSVTPSDEQRLAKGFVAELASGRPADAARGPAPAPRQGEGEVL